MQRIFKLGDTIKYFKRDFLSTTEAQDAKYYYWYRGEAIHSKTKERLVILRHIIDGECIAIPYDDFMAKVDKTKYSTAKQLFQYEKVKGM